MDRYEWQLNKAIVERMYYSERIVEVTFGFAIMGTLFDLNMIRQNYFVERSKARIPKYWLFAGGFSALSLFILLRPLTSAEIQNQWQKRLKMGKWLTSMYHLEDVYAPKAEEKTQ